MLLECNLYTRKNDCPKQIKVINYESIRNELISFDFNAHDFEEFTKMFTNLVKKHTEYKNSRNNINFNKSWMDSELKIELKKEKIYLN